MRRILSLAIALAALIAGSGILTRGRHASTTAPTTSTAAIPAGQTGECATLLLGGRPPVIPTKLAARTTSLCYSSFTVLHSAVTRTPLWSAEVLTPASIAVARRTERASDFEAERRLPHDERAELADYRRSGYDRGHLAPSGDMPGPEAQAESFTLANIVPQDADLNRGRWSDMESDVRRETARNQQVFVVTGTLYEGAKLQTTATGRVVIPTSVWKAVAVPGEGSFAVVASNAPGGSWETMTVDQFTRRTGIDPFPALSEEARRTLIDIR